MPSNSPIRRRVSILSLCLKWILPFILLLIAILCIWQSYHAPVTKPDEAIALPLLQNLKKQHHITSGHIILVDFSKHSCENRLYIYAAETMQVEYSGAVLHGNGRNSTDQVPEFSNEIGSNCSSVGMYKVAEPGRMRIGYPCLRMDGLDSTNSNARIRGILIHPSIRVSLLPWEMKGRNFKLSNSSNGCFAVSLRTYNKIKNLPRPIYLFATKL